jgi:hypothetical protein
MLEMFKKRPTPADTAGQDGKPGDES